MTGSVRDRHRSAPAAAAVRPPASRPLWAGLAELRLVVASTGTAGGPTLLWAAAADGLPVEAAATRRTAPGGSGAAGRDVGAEPDRVAALVELAQRGDSEAFAAIYDLYVDQVYRYVYYRVGTQPLAEDLTSETFLRALRGIGSFRWQGRDIGAWFTTIARNLVTDHVKSARFRLEVSTADMLDADRPGQGDAPVEAAVIERLENARLLDAVRSLKPDQQECIVLRFLQGLGIAETAAVMGRSEGAVKQLQLRAVRALAKVLDVVPGAASTGADLP